MVTITDEAFRPHGSAEVWDLPLAFAELLTELV
jgi:hypothetical protein